MWREKRNEKKRNERKNGRSYTTCAARGSYGTGERTARVRTAVGVAKMNF